MSARDAVLDAFADLLIGDGERAATLDAVAARAQVSKGGLLYHFKSRDALVDGLIERLRELAAADVAAMRVAPEGPSAYYVSSSDFAGSPLDRALVATARLAQNASPSARDAMREIQQQWYALIAEEVGDPASARAILLIGDGLYYNAALAGGPSSAPTPGGSAGDGGGAGDDGGDDGADCPAASEPEADDDIAALLGVVELLKRHAATRG
ncbi:TetR/AcrR family transcriptional regulator [Georgenia sp. MJ206]|uniref:TetR/AcrR family transcriptional regulator n=1 Tax=Georgenia wangjunii TaxID=3117730 RepID=UPI002F265625